MTAGAAEKILQDFYQKFNKISAPGGKRGACGLHGTDAVVAFRKTTEQD